MLTIKKKKSTGEGKMTVLVGAQPWQSHSMKRFVAKLSAISVIPQFRILYAVLKCL